MLHILHTDIKPPSELNNPFSYEPHALTLMAAGQLREYLYTKPELAEEIAEGKMFGVLVCRDPQKRLGFLAAYSGQLAGRADWPWFVPAVFDYLQPDGHFKQEESRISAINREIRALSESTVYLNLVAKWDSVRAEGEADVERFRQYMNERKQQRDALRASGEQQEEQLVRESQH